MRDPGVKWGALPHCEWMMAMQRPPSHYHGEPATLFSFLYPSRNQESECKWQIHQSQVVWQLVPVTELLRMGGNRKVKRELQWEEVNLRPFWSEAAAAFTVWVLKSPWNWSLALLCSSVQEILFNNLKKKSLIVSIMCQGFWSVPRMSRTASVLNIVKIRFLGTLTTI